MGNLGCKKWLYHLFLPWYFLFKTIEKHPSWLPFLSFFNPLNYSPCPMFHHHDCRFLCLQMFHHAPFQRKGRDPAIHHQKKSTGSLTGGWGDSDDALFCLGFVDYLQDSKWDTGTRWSFDGYESTDGTRWLVWMVSQKSLVRLEQTWKKTTGWICKTCNSPLGIVWVVVVVWSKWKVKENT